MPRSDVVIIGGGQAGLAMSRCLADRGIAHVVLERGRVAERWRSERWDSLRLLTPNWQTPAAGLAYDGPEPDGFMTMRRGRRATSTRYARAARYRCAPARACVAVQRARRATATEVATDSRHVEAARAVVIATGHCDTPLVPALAQRAARRHRRSSRRRSTATRRSCPQAACWSSARRPPACSSPTRLQRAGTARCTLAVGRHTRVPRRYRGRDILWWLDAHGRARRDGDRGLRPPGVARRSRRSSWSDGPTAPRSTCGTLQAAGVRVVGPAASRRRHASCTSTTISSRRPSQPTSSWRGCCSARIDALRATAGRRTAGPPEPFAPHWRALVDAAPTPRPATPAASAASLWATGFRRDYPWLQVPVLGARRRDPSTTAASRRCRACYVLGLRFLRRRQSSFLDGVGDDARELAAHLAAHLDAVARAAPWPWPTGSCPNGTRHDLRRDQHLADVVVVGARCAGAATALLLARAGPARCSSSTAGGYGSDTLSTHALMRGGVLQLHRWGLLRRCARGTPAVRTTTFHYGDARASTVAIKARDGVDALLRRGARCSTRVLVDAARDARRRGAARRTGSSTCCAAAAGASPGVLTHDDDGQPHRASTPAS